MKIGKILIAAVAVTVFSIILGMITCGGFFNWIYQLKPAYVWKPMEGFPGMFFLVGNFVLNILLASVYALFRKGIPGGNKFIKGIVFGLSVFAVGKLPGILATYTFMVVAPTVVVYWAILGLIEMPLKGLIIAVIHDR